MSADGVVTFEKVVMDGGTWFARNRGGGWRTMIDVVTGLATLESCFIENSRFKRMVVTGRAVAVPVAVAEVARSHHWFTWSRPVGSPSTTLATSPASTAREMA